MIKGRILIITDGLEEFVWLPSYFMAQGHDVFAASRDEAVAIASKHLPEVILLNSPFVNSAKKFWYNHTADLLWSEIRAISPVARYSNFIFLLNSSESFDVVIGERIIDSDDYMFMDDLRDDVKRWLDENVHR